MHLAQHPRLAATIVHALMVKFQEACGDGPALVDGAVYLLQRVPFFTVTPIRGELGVGGRLRAGRDDRRKRFSPYYHGTQQNILNIILLGHTTELHIHDHVHISTVCKKK